MSEHNTGKKYMEEHNTGNKYMEEHNIGNKYMEEHKNKYMIINNICVSIVKL